jgi:signal transduction histidine kinase
MSRDDRILGVSAYPLRRDDGTARGVLALFVDLTATARQERRDRLTASLSQLGELSAGLAHELRNGLATLRGYLTLIERRPRSGSVDEYLEQMRGEADHLQQVLDDFLSFARPERPEEAPLDIASLLRQAAADPALAPQRVLWEEPRTPPPPVSGDAKLLRRALRNLLLNATQAQQAAGAEEALELTLESDADRLTVRIRDRGPGLPEGADRLVQPFVSGRADGVGLGLSLTIIAVPTG